MDGGNGADVLIGGLGRDILVGGNGPDKFVFNAIEETAVGAQRDWLADFSIEDTIALSAIDADTGRAGDQAFLFIGSSAFTGVAGQLRFYADGGDMILAGDVNGDSLPDFEIGFTGMPLLVTNVFML